MITTAQVMNQGEQIAFHELEQIVGKDDAIALMLSDLRGCGYGFLEDVARRYSKDPAAELAELAEAFRDLFLHPPCPEDDQSNLIEFVAWWRMADLCSWIDAEPTVGEVADWHTLNAYRWIISVANTGSLRLLTLPTQEILGGAFTPVGPAGVVSTTP